MHRLHAVFDRILNLGSIVHTQLIEGTRETRTTFPLCTLVLAVTMKVLCDRRVWITQTPWKTKA